MCGYTVLGSVHLRLRPQREGGNAMHPRTSTAGFLGSKNVHTKAATEYLVSVR
jgi:hypothetical protein